MANVTLKRWWWTRHYSNGRCDTTTHNAIVRDVAACNSTIRSVAAQSVTIHLGSQNNFILFSSYLTLATSRIFKAPPVSHMHEKENFETHLLQDTSLPHLVSLFPTPPIPALLVSRGVITQVPSSSNNNTSGNTNNNNTNKRNSRTQNQKKPIAFNIKQQRVVFL